MDLIEHLYFFVMDASELNTVSKKSYEKTRFVIAYNNEVGE